MPKEPKKSKDLLLADMISLIKKIDKSKSSSQKTKSKGATEETVQPQLSLNELQRALNTAITTKNITEEDLVKILRYILRRLTENPDVKKDKALMKVVNKLNDKLMPLNQDEIVCLQEDARAFINAGLVETNSTLYNIAKLIIDPLYVTTTLENSEDVRTRPSSSPILAAAQLAADRQQSKWQAAKPKLEAAVPRFRQLAEQRSAAMSSKPQQPKPEQPKP